MYSLVARHAPWLSTLAATSGIALHGYAVFSASGEQLDAVMLVGFAYLCLPYLFCLLTALLRSPFLALFGAGAALAADLFAYRSTFMVHASSTAALSFLLSPVVDLLFFVPLGMLAADSLVQIYGDRERSADR